MLQRSVLTLLSASLMVLAPSFPAPLFSNQALSSAQAAENKRFAPHEMGTLFLDPEALTSSSEAELKSFFDYSSLLSRQFPAGLRQQLQGTLHQVDAIQAHVMDVLREQSSEIQPHMEVYAPVLDIPLDYRVIGQMRKYDLRALAEESNQLLEHGYKVPLSVVLADSLLPALNSELPQLNDASKHHKAAMGIAAVTLLNLVVQAQHHAGKLRPEYVSLQKRLEAQGKSVQRKIQSNPMAALSMGEELQLLLDMTSTLNDSADKVGQAAEKLPSLLGSAMAVVSSVSQAF